MNATPRRLEGMRRQITDCRRIADSDSALHTLYSAILPLRAPGDLYRSGSRFGYVIRFDRVTNAHFAPVPDCPLGANLAAMFDLDRSGPFRKPNGIPAVKLEHRRAARVTKDARIARVANRLRPDVRVAALDRAEEHRVGSNLQCSTDCLARDCCDKVVRSLDRCGGATGCTSAARA